MKSIRITDEEVKAILPSNIRETDVISEDAKKVLASILNYYKCLDIVRESGYLVCPNTALRNSAGIKYNNMIKAIQELIDYDLIEREAGKRWSSGEKHTASKYTIRWDNITKKLEKKSFEDLFSDFLKPPKTLMGTIDIDTDIEIDTEIDYDADSDAAIATASANDFNLDNNYIITEINTMEEPLKTEPTNLKELSDYIRTKAVNTSKDCKTIRELEEVKNLLAQELEDKYSNIPSYRNCLYSLNNYFQRRVEDLMVPELVNKIEITA